MNFFLKKVNDTAPNCVTSGVGNCEWCTTGPTCTACASSKYLNSTTAPQSCLTNCFTTNNSLCGCYLLINNCFLKFLIFEPK